MSAKQMSYTERELANIADRMHEAIVVNGHPTIARHIFESKFLGFFLGKTIYNNPGDVYAAWISIAGSASSAVNVIDTDGSVCYTVPPFIDTSMLSRDGSSDNSASKVIGNAKAMISPLTPASLADEITLNAVKLATTQDVQEHMSKKQAWVEFLSRWDPTIKSETGSQEIKEEEPEEEVTFS